MGVGLRPRRQSGLAPPRRPGREKNVWRPPAAFWVQSPFNPRGKEGDGTGWVLGCVRGARVSVAPTQTPGEGKKCLAPPRRGVLASNLRLIREEKRGMGRDGCWVASAAPEWPSTTQTPGEGKKCLAPPRSILASNLRLIREEKRGWDGTHADRSFPMTCYDSSPTHKPN